MSNRLKVMLLIGLFWIVLQIILLVTGFSPMLVLLFAVLGSTISILIGMYLDVYNDKAGEWFDQEEFF